MAATGELQVSSTTRWHREVPIAGMPAPTWQWQFVGPALRESQVLQVQSAELPMWQQQPSSLWELACQRLGNFRSAQPPGGIERCLALACQLPHGWARGWCSMEAANAATAAPDALPRHPILLVGAAIAATAAAQFTSTTGVHREVAVAGMPAPTCQWQRGKQLLQVQSAEQPVWQQQPSPCGSCHGSDWALQPPRPPGCSE